MGKKPPLGGTFCGIETLSESSGVQKMWFLRASAVGACRYERRVERSWMLAAAGHLWSAPF